MSDELIPELSIFFVGRLPIVIEDRALRPAHDLFGRIVQPSLPVPDVPAEVGDIPEVIAVLADQPLRIPEVGQMCRVR